MTQALIRFSTKAQIDQFVTASGLPLIVEPHDDIFLVVASEAPEHWDHRPAMAKAIQDLADKDSVEVQKRHAAKKAQEAAAKAARDAETLTAADVGVVPAAVVAAQPVRRR